MHDQHLEAMADGQPAAGITLHKGFPNAALDHTGRRTPLALDLNQLLIRHPTSTYLFRIQGDTWQGSGIFEGDIALIDRLPTPQASDLVLSWQTDHFEITSRRQLSADATVWGVVSAVIHQYKSEVPV